MEFEFFKLKFSIEDGKIRLGGYPLAEVHIAGEKKDSHYGLKMVRSSECEKLYYVSHELSDSGLIIVQRSELVEVKTVLSTYSGTFGFKVHSEVTNISDKEITLEEASALVYGGILGGINETENAYIYRFTQSHHGECQPRKFSLFDLGLFNANPISQKRVFGANIGSWSTKEELPQAILEYKGDHTMFSIESNNDWYWEISDFAEKMYLFVGGGNINFGGWYKKLAPNQTYSTVCVNFAFGKCLDCVVGEMTKLRRAGRTIRETDMGLPVIFNEYMHLSWDSPTEENTRKIAPVASALGAKYYVIDCGWHNEEDGNIIYPYVGQWKESKKRFPSGVKATLDYIKALGLKPGLWIEPEIIGEKCEEMLAFYDDDCFIRRHGKKVAVMGRLFLDFRNEKVVDYLSGTIRRMVEEYGAEYIKMDYNQDMGVGTDIDCDGFGEGLEQTQKAYLDWARTMIARYPNVIFETCSSGGMRMDDKTLSQFDMVSTSDQTLYYKYPYIVGNVFSAVLPEQAGVWSYPVNSYDDGDDKFEPTEECVRRRVSGEIVAMNMINALLGRMHLSSHVELLSKENQALIKEGIAYYEKLVEMKKRALPVFPLGFTDFRADNVAAGLKDGDKIYLAVWHLKGDKEVKIPFKRNVAKANVGYPLNMPIEYCSEKNVLTVRFSEEKQARLFEITLI
ncbi:MAG: alpha-galactosidase [Clostridia bacterium]|nr:alpha-galactosidase [Clostridia bacterium]